MDDLKAKFETELPGVFYLQNNIQKALSDYLKEKKWIPSSDKVIDLEKPGEGNMNFVIRVKTSEKSIILKQSRPWVEKYPTVQAPVERLNVEAKYYEVIHQQNLLQDYSPELIGFDPENYIIALEDLGEGIDYTYLYQKDQFLSEREIKQINEYISALHKIDHIDFPDNTSMKVLNHEHIFKFPFEEQNDFNLDTVTEGLRDVSLSYKRNNELKKKIKELGDVYLEKGNTLIHGDYYPGSWLNVSGNVKVIDPEFSYLGYAEFDLGVMMAHMKMSEQPEKIMQNVLVEYQRPQNFDLSLFVGFVGVEIMRRILGLAQLPLSFDLDHKKYLLEEAEQFILQPDQSYLLQLVVR